MDLVVVSKIGGPAPGQYLAPIMHSLCKFNVGSMAGLEIRRCLPCSVLRLYLRKIWPHAQGQLRIASNSDEGLEAYLLVLTCFLPIGVSYL